MNTNLILKLILVIIILGGSYLVYKNFSSSDKMMMDGDSMMIGEDKMMMGDDKMMKNDVNDFESCVAAGGSVDPKYPNECIYQGDMVFVKDGMMFVGEDKMMKEEDSMMMEKMDDKMIKKEEAGKYIKYKDFDMSAHNGKVVLDFYASWCPTCKAFKNNVMENLNKIPSGVTIVEVDYDSQKDLVKKYGVKYQHTFVQIDKDGKEVNKWSGSMTLDEFSKNLK